MARQVSSASVPSTGDDLRGAGTTGRRTELGIRDQGRTEFEAEIAELSEGGSPDPVLALRKGVHAQRAFARWCQEAIDTLEAHA
jgi:hypothetical protein